MRLTVLFHRFGPYHWARLEAAGRRGKVCGIELSGETEEYAWAKIDQVGKFQHVTVYPQGDIRSLPLPIMRKKIFAALDSVDSDVIAIHGWSAPDALIALNWCIQTQTPAVVMSDSLAGNDRPWWKEAIKRQIVSTFEAGFVAGQPHVDYLASLGLLEEKIFIGYDVVDNTHFRVGADKAKRNEEALRLQLNLPQNYFLVVARFIKEKNLLRLIDSYAHYLEKSPITPWDLVLVGDGPLRVQIETVVRRYGIGENVHLLGFLQYDELPTIYGLASAFILPSVSETWGLVVNEAMSVGLPVIVSERCGCVDDLVHEGRNGLIFDPEDTVALADQMAHLASADDRRDAMGKASRAIIDNWSPETFATNLMKAARTAMQAEVEPSGLMDRLLLNALLRR